VLPLPRSVVRAAALAAVTLFVVVEENVLFDQAVVPLVPSSEANLISMLSREAEVIDVLMKATVPAIDLTLAGITNDVSVCATKERDTGLPVSEVGFPISYVVSKGKV